MAQRSLQALQDAMSAHQWGWHAAPWTPTGRAGRTKPGGTLPQRARVFQPGPLGSPYEDLPASREWPSTCLAGTAAPVGHSETLQGVTSAAGYLSRTCRTVRWGANMEGWQTRHDEMRDELGSHQDLEPGEWQ